MELRFLRRWNRSYVHRGAAAGEPRSLLDFRQFRLGGGKLLLEVLDFVGIVHLFAGAGQLLPQGGDSRVENVDPLLRFFVHDKVPQDVEG